jgi:hypothetical protein
MIKNFQRFGNKCYGYTDRERIIIVRDSVLLSLWIVTIIDTMMVEGKDHWCGDTVLVGKWNIIL